MTGVTTELVRAVREGLAGLADPAKAADMRAYMKSEMPFYGVLAPGRRVLAKRVFAAHPLPTADDWLAAATTLWRGATRREERYLAIELLDQRRYAHWRAPDLLRGWATDADRWRRRSAIICQLGARADTDVDLLTYAIEANIADRDFFLRKAIGWALRHHARTDPGWVRAFVDAHPDLSGLSRREATKHL